MATSIVAICNLALTRIGTRSQIQALTEDSVEARTAKLLYEFARDATLERHDWNFARKRVALAEIGTPAAGWGYRYALPSDCLAVRSLETPTRTDRKPPYRIEGGTLLTDTPVAVLVYTARIADPAAYSPSFVVALSWGLGADLAVPLTGNLQQRQQCVQMWQAALNTAAVADANAEGPDEVPDASWIAARN